MKTKRWSTSAGTSSDVNTNKNGHEQIKKMHRRSMSFDELMCMEEPVLNGLVVKAE